MGIEQVDKYLAEVKRLVKEAAELVESEIQKESRRFYELTGQLETDYRTKAVELDQRQMETVEQYDAELRRLLEEQEKVSENLAWLRSELAGLKTRLGEVLS